MGRDFAPNKLSFVLLLFVWVSLIESGFAEFLGYFAIYPWIFKSHQECYFLCTTIFSFTHILETLSPVYLRISVSQNTKIPIINDHPIIFLWIIIFL